MRERMEKWSPPGWDNGTERKIFWIFLTVCILYSFQFFGRYWSAYEALFFYEKGERLLRPYAEMPPLRSLLDGCFLAFWGMFLWSLGSAALRYAYFYEESKSIYFVRRLPDRTYLWKSCLTVPTLGLIFSLLVMGCLALVYFGVYLGVTPSAALRP